MSKEDIEVLHRAFAAVNLKIEKPKFYKIVRQPGPERLLFLQRCLSQLCGEGQGNSTLIDANSLEKPKELEEEIAKYIAAYGLCKERRVITGYGSERDNLLFWNRLLVLIQSYQQGRSGDSRRDWKKSLAFMSELIQHPQLEKVLQPPKKQLILDFSADSSSEEELMHTKIQDSQDDYMEQSVSPTFQQQEDNCGKLCHRLKENLHLLHERLEEFKDASKSIPKMENAPVSGMGEAIEEQCTQLMRIKEFYSSAEKIESAVDFLSDVEPPDVTPTKSEDLLFNNICPDLLNGLL